MYFQTTSCEASAYILMFEWGLKSSNVTPGLINPLWVPFGIQIMTIRGNTALIM